MINDEELTMNKILTIVVLIFLAHFSFAGDSIVGKWRGAIVGHVDDKDYFINAAIKWVKDSTYSVQLKVFSKDYTGEFVLNTTLKNKNKLYINSFTRLSEFPTTYAHIEDCFTGYFQWKQPRNNIEELDLYRNPIYRKIEDFTVKDTAGEFLPSFECFTSVLLHPTVNDTSLQKLEKQTDSIITNKKNTNKDASKRKVVSSKEWTVTNKKITLQIWDNNKEDGDIISLKFNDTWILSNFLLKKEKHTITLELKEKDNQLLMFAENLGSIPPNTAAISIDDNVLVRTFMLNSDMSKSESVKIFLDTAKK
jgi:hypothetical protein